MRSLIALALTGGVLAAATAASPAAPVQDRVPIPGQMTQGKVWIQNAGPGEAVPITLENVNRSAPPIRVEVLGTTEVALASGVVLQAQARATRQQWEHRTVTLLPDQDAAAALAGAGAEGWEAVGLQAAAKGSTIVLMKRPR